MRSKKIDLAGQVMSRIKKDHIRLKPRWWFIAGSVAMISGVAASFLVSVFLVSLISFSLKTHGPMGEIRLQQIWTNFPWWAPVLAVFGICSGVILLKRYDFSYRKNFLLIIIGFILAIIFSGWLLDYSGLDNYIAGQGLMKRMYQQYDGGYRGRGRMLNQGDNVSPGYGKGRGRQNMMNQ